MIQVYLYITWFCHGKYYLIDLMAICSTFNIYKVKNSEELILSPTFSFFISHKVKIINKPFRPKLEKNVTINL